MLHRIAAKERECLTYLVNTLSNEISREALLKEILVLEWIMQLRKWHASTLEPTIEHLIDTLEWWNIGATARWDGNVIDAMMGNGG
jgi:hypothetical protein